MSRIEKQDTQGTKPLLSTGELGYDNYPAGGDVGRVYVGTGAENIAIAKKSEVTVLDNKTNAHIARVDNPHSVTKAQVGLGNADNTADVNKSVLSATKLTTPRSITISGEVAGSVSFDGSTDVNISTTIQPNSVALGTDTTGNYVSSVIAGSGVTVTGVVGEGWTPSIAIAPVGTSGTYTKVLTNDKGQVVSGESLTANDIPNLDASKITSGIIDAARLPAYVDDVLEYASLSVFPVVGESGKIYIALDTNKAYRWSGSTYVYITSGAVDSVAGKTGVVTLVKADVELANVDNTSDANKPISTATQNALNLKANAANAVLTGIPTAPTAAVGTNTTQLATTAYVKAEVANETYSKTQLNNGQLDNRYYTKTNLDGGQLDNRYYTETELNNGALDTRYYTEAEIDAKLAGQNDASEINVTPTGNLTSTNVQAALVELQGDIDDRYTKAQADTLLGRVMTSGGRDVYLGSYGLEWNETTDTYRRIGAENYTAIQSLMKRCVLNGDGSVKYYLDPNNSNYKEDGTLAKLDGTDGNVMVEIPKTYVRYEYSTTGGAGTDTVHRWEISLTPDTGFEAHWAFNRGGAIRDKRYYPAYLGYVTGGRMISRSGVYPTTSQTLAQFRTAAKANSVSNPSTGQTANGYWGNIDFALYELIALYAVIEYGTMNIQSALGGGRTALTGGAWVGGELIGINGLSNEYGNRTANYTYVGASTDANADLSFMSYRGCENFFGNVWRMADGVIFKGTTNNKTMWYSTSPTGYNETGTGYTNSGVVTAAAGGYGRKLANTNRGFIVSDVTGGNSNAGTTDYYYTSTTDDTVARVGGASAAGLGSGPLALHVLDSAASLSAVSVGCGVSF